MIQCAHTFGFEELAQPREFDDEELHVIVCIDACAYSAHRIEHTHLPKALAKIEVGKRHALVIGKLEEAEM